MRNVNYDVITREIEPRGTSRAWRPLGRHVEHDTRSREYKVTPRAFKAPQSVWWPHVAHILDQGDVGACTGFAAAALLGTASKARLGSPWMSNDNGMYFYERATHLDNIKGTYPPEDTGSSGIAAMKVLKEGGHVKGYKHAFSTDALLTALQTTPVLMGINWYDDMFYPDSGGFVSPGGESAGGHEICVVGYDMHSQYVKFVNSWGEGWGDGGYFRMWLTDVDKLLKEDGDVTVPVWK